MRLALVTMVAAAAGQTFAAERWVALEAPRFTVVSQMSESATREWASQFEQYIGALRRNIKVDESKLPQLTMILFASVRDFEPYKPRQPDGRPSSVVGFFARRDNWSVAAVASRSPGTETRRIIFHEGAHWYMSPIETPRPDWLEEGIAEVYSTFESENGEMRLGKAVERHVGALRNYPIVPMEKLVGINAHESVFNDEDRFGSYYARSWLFAHYRLFGVHAGNRDLLGPYLDLARSGESAESAFRKSFGMDYQQADRALHSYMVAGRYELARYPIEPSTVSDRTLAAAPPFSVKTALARLALGSHNAGQAASDAREAIALEPRNPLGYELLGMALGDAQLGDEAAVSYADAAARGSRSFRVYQELGRYRLYGFAPPPRVVSAEGKSDADGRAAADLFIHAISLQPKSADGYLGLAAALDLVSAPTDLHRMNLTEGHRLFPDNGQLTLALANVSQKLRDRPEANRLLDEVLAGGGKHPPAVLDYARRLSTRWKFDALRDEVGRLDERGDLAGALRTLDAAPVDTLSPIQRRTLADIRQDIVIRSHLREAQAAWDANRWVDARRAATAVIEMEIPATAKFEATRVLRDLERIGK